MKPINFQFGNSKLITDNSWTLISFNEKFYTDSIHRIVDGNVVGTKQYAVVFDAGSSSTKLLAYEFLMMYPDERLILKNEFFSKVTPGLSSYREDPKKAAESIEGLLEKVKSFVPQEHWPSTPLVLKATAGLRLLKPVEAENLLNAVREALSKSGFLVKDNAVEIMDGADEGIFSWFTVNILLGKYLIYLFLILNQLKF